MSIITSSYVLPSKNSENGWTSTTSRRRLDDSKFGTNRLDLLLWNTDNVVSWLQGLGLSIYESIFRDNDITGDVIAHANHTLLKELDINVIGHRLIILKSLYTIKMQQGIEILPGDYVPETVNFSGRGNNSNYNQYEEVIRKLEWTVNQQCATITTLTNDLNNLSIEFSRLKDELVPIWPIAAEYASHKSKKNKSKKDKPKDKEKSQESNSKESVKEKSTSPLKFSPTTSVKAKTPWSADSPNSSNSSLVPPIGIRVYMEDEINKLAGASYKTFSVTTQCTAQKLIPEILRKFKISEEEASRFGLYARQKGPDSIVTPEEKPYLIIQEKQISDDDPIVFVLKSDEVAYYGEQFI